MAPADVSSTQPVDPTRDAWPTAGTRLVGIIGSPVRHSLSPALHNAAFGELGLDWAYLAFEVPEGSALAALIGVRALGLEGLNVTMPHKTAIGAGCDRLSATAERLGSVNTVCRRSGDLVGENTDGEGFVASLRAAGIEPEGYRCVVVGAGGAGRAVTLALAHAGAAAVAVLARRPEAASRAAALAGPAGGLAGPGALAGADLVVNATPVGMAGTPGEGALPFDPALLGVGQVVADLVYHPVSTPLLSAAAAAGARCIDGTGMLVHQAAAAFRLWTGEEPPLTVMVAAARAAIEQTEA